MPGWETVFAALGGLVLGAGFMAWRGQQRVRRLLRRRVALETRLRRDVVPVLERRADVLAIPPADRGHDADNPVDVVHALARAIRLEEESHELPFGDTVDASRDDLLDELEKVGQT